MTLRYGCSDSCRVGPDHGDGGGYGHGSRDGGCMMVVKKSEKGRWRAMTLRVVIVPGAKIMAVAMAITSEDSRHCFLVACLWEESQKQGTLWKRTDKGKAVEGTCPSTAVSYAGSHALRPGAQCFNSVSTASRGCPSCPGPSPAFGPHWAPLGEKAGCCNEQIPKGRSLGVEFWFEGG